MLPLIPGNSGGVGGFRSLLGHWFGGLCSRFGGTFVHGPFCVTSVQMTVAGADGIQMTVAGPDALQMSGSGGIIQTSASGPTSLQRSVAGPDSIQMGCN
mgnify:CR=1 FL=1